MILFPAIDIQNGQCVRLRRGDFAEATVFSTDPVARARMFQDEGAEALHVVDLDGARTGKMVNLALIEEIAETITIPVEFGGGVRTLKDLQLIHNGPVSRVVLGTSAVTDQQLLMEAVKLMGEQLVISVDADRGMVTTHGWQERSSVSAVRFASYLQEEGVKHILYTDIDRDGMMMGMNLEAVRELAESVAIDIIASGGISSLDDLKRLKALGVPNISSVIVGRALYEGTFTIAEARAILD
ncbi:MAG: 1-(5-phosphoribosyl)-5-[(5-phosphoribosylamino)methylideneamino]imidazole-4-carboxamide isomerase [Actinobacteria bacterium]|nr:1-(5-phosphoribosyl)-5-[(5-phosphoribosylamino)methylideneamino]imidazole-4-carboxamide isomerase [Actinomycetota bacterium]MCL5883717.1 1-(5-phosphoribosyl)-5-[(5-phosphoribosylamino)methylideneamino]imidazole-4-carboxamide isomerase [Actinomycetota bacterium]